MLTSFVWFWQVCLNITQYWSCQILKIILALCSWAKLYITLHLVVFWTHISWQYKILNDCPACSHSSHGQLRAVVFRVIALVLSVILKCLFASNWPLPCLNEATLFSIKHERSGRVSGLLVWDSPEALCNVSFILCFSTGSTQEDREHPDKDYSTMWLVLHGLLSFCLRTCWAPFFLPASTLMCYSVFWAQCVIWGHFLCALCLKIGNLRCYHSTVKWMNWIGIPTPLCLLIKLSEPSGIMSMLLDVCLIYKDIYRVWSYPS